MTLAKRTSPSVLLRETDAGRLADLALRSETTNPFVAGLLLDEIARARILPDDRVPPDVVAMGSTVVFRDEARGQEQRVQLVFPHEADIGAGRISILTPVGAGLIGLRAGQSILWPDRKGEKRLLRVLEVTARQRAV